MNNQAQAHRPCSIPFISALASWSLEEGKVRPEHVAFEQVLK